MIKHFQIATLDIRIRPVTSLHLPSLPAFLLRGGMGYALKRSLCHSTFNTKCEHCNYINDCLYPLLYEEINIESNNPKYIGYTRPFILHTGLNNRYRYQQKEHYHFRIHLFGNTIQYFYHYISALVQLGKKGIGKFKEKFEVEKITSPNFSGLHQLLYDGQTDEIRNTPTIISGLQIQEHTKNMSYTGLELELVTPFRLRVQGKYQSHFTFYDLMENIFRRIRMVSYHHHGTNVDEQEIEMLLDKALDVVISNQDLKWSDVSRFSTRQKAEMKLGGIIGTIRFFGDIVPFLPFILLGQYLHIGKQTAFGLGEYKLQFI